MLVYEFGHKKRHEELILVKRFDASEYQRYDNYDAVEVSKIVDIPFDYAGIMGVPITFMNKYNPDQFEIVGMSHGDMGQALGVSAISQKNSVKNISVKIKHSGEALCVIQMRRKCDCTLHANSDKEQASRNTEGGRYHDGYKRIESDSR